MPLISAPSTTPLLRALPPSRRFARCVASTFAPCASSRCGWCRSTSRAARRAWATSLFAAAPWGTPVLSLRDYATVMVVESDNTATNVLIAHLGMEAITVRMAQAGLANTRLRRYMIDLDAAKRGLENVSTPAELARLLEMFYKGTGLTPTSQAEALRILKKPKDSPIRRAVPAGIEVASKTGSLEGVRADTAIVYAKNRPFVFVALTTFLANEAAANKAIEDMAAVAFGYYARLGAAGETGRLLYR